MFQAIIYTEDVGGVQMVKSWELKRDDDPIIPPNSTIIDVPDIPNDFYLNFFDYYIDTNGDLQKIAVPTNNTLNRPEDNFEYLYGIFRLNAYDIFKNL